VSDDDGLSAQGQFKIHVLTNGPTKFYVVDQSAHVNPSDRAAVFAYDMVGNLNPSGGFDLSSNNQRPWGIVTNAAMSNLWIVDAQQNVQVHIYKPDGTHVGNWIADFVKKAQDIATDGSDMWIVDDGSNTVWRFHTGASWTGTTSGEHHAPDPISSSDPFPSFRLDPANQSPTGMVTDGKTIWVTDSHGNTNTVFVYDAAHGTRLGEWTLDPAWPGRIGDIAYSSRKRSCPGSDSAALPFLGGRPRGRNVNSRPSRAAVLFTQVSEPKGRPRWTDCRSRANSASVCGSSTWFDQSFGNATGPG
jgi:hypothetical protein